MRNFYILVILAICSLKMEAQTRLIGERSVYTQYYLSPYLLNPGATGQREFGELMGTYRNNWATFPGAPKTITLSYEGPIGNRIGIGLNGVTDSYAGFQTTKGGLSMSYTIESPKNKIGVGIGGEYIRHKLNGDVLSNPYNGTIDPEILRRLDGYAFFDASFGIYGMYDNKITYGVSFPSLVSQQISGNEDPNYIPEKKLNFIASLGYRLAIPEKDLVIEPSVYVKQLMLVPLHVDANLIGKFLGEQLTTGLTFSYGADNRIGFLIGTQQSNFGIHYSYNMSLHEFQQYNNGSHEISLRLRFQPFKSPTK